MLVSVAVLVVPFLPASNLLFRVGFVIAERNLYLPSLGFIMLVTLGVCALSRMEVGKVCPYCFTCCVAMKTIYVPIVTSSVVYFYSVYFIVYLNTVPLF